MTDSLTDDELEPWGDHLRARRDAVADAITMPPIAELLASADESARIPARARRSPSGPQRRGMLAAAAVILLIAGVGVLVRPDPQRVTTRPRSAASALVDAGIPLLFPPGDPSTVDAGLGDEIADTASSTVGATITSYVAGDVGDAARYFTVVIDRDGPDGFDAIGSLTPSGQFQPTPWFADETDRGSPEDTTFLPHGFEGSQQAILADSTNRADILAILHDSTRVVVYAYGMTTDDLLDIGRSLQWTDDGDVEMGDVPEPFVAVDPGAGVGRVWASVNVRSADASLDLTPRDAAGFQIALALSNTDAALPEHRVLRAAPDLVLALGNGPTPRVVGLRGGAWADLRLDPERPSATADLLTTFDGLREVEPTTFDAALDRRDQREAAELDTRLDDLTDLIDERGGWIPTRVPAGALLVSATETGYGFDPAANGATPELPTVWNPSSGAVIRFHPTPWLAVDEASTKLLGTTRIGGRNVEFRSHPDAPNAFFAWIGDRSTADALPIYGTDIDQVTFTDIVGTLVELGDGRWAMPTPAGFELLPGVLPGAPPSSGTRNAIDFGFDTDTRSAPAPGTDPVMPDLTVSVTPVDPSVYGVVSGSFFDRGRVQRSSDVHGTFYRIVAGPDAAEHSVLIPGTDDRPQVIVTAAGARTDDELVEIGRAVAASSDAAVTTLLMPLR